MSRLAFPICSVAERSATLRDTWPALTGRCCGSPVFVPTTPAASHGVSTLRLSSPYLQYDSNGTFRNVPLLLSHACPCAVRFDAYIVEKTKHWNLDLSHYAPASRPEPPEPLVCSDYERCQHCNYMAHGFQCEHGNGKCVLTDMEELNGRRQIFVQSITGK